MRLAPRDHDAGRAKQRLGGSVTRPHHCDDRPRRSPVVHGSHGLMQGRIERLADGVEARESETSKRRDCLLVNGAHTFDDDWCVLGMLKWKLEVVHAWA